MGTEWGSVQVSLGETRCLVTVSCEMVTPKSSRPNEGQLYINVEFSSMSAAHFEAGRSPEIGIQISRILERAYTDSRCVDLESLCVVSEEKVWSLRVDIAVLNDAGNVCDCASLGALAALSHFRRPDVTTSGDSITIHSDRERDPIPLVLHHFPVCVSFAVFESGEFSVADPTSLEERVSQSNLVFGMNSYKELCGLHLGGVYLTNPALLIRTAGIAARQAKYFVELIRSAVETDSATREERGEKVSFMQCIKDNAFKTNEQDRIFVKLRKVHKIEEKNSRDGEIETCQEKAAAEAAPEIVGLGEKTAVLLPKSEQWIPDTESSDTEKQEETSPQEKKRKKQKKTSKKREDSEEKDTMQLE